MPGLRRAESDVDPFLAEDTDGKAASDVHDEEEVGKPSKAWLEGSSVWTAMWVLLCAILAGTAAVLAIRFGPSEVLKEILRTLVPERPRVWHAVAIWTFLTLTLTFGIPFLIVLLLPAPALMFGFVAGFGITFAALLTAATVSFLIGKSLFQQPIRNFLHQHHCRRSLRALRVLEDERDRMWFLVLFRFLTIPMLIRNYGPAILSIPSWQLFISAVPHSAWAAFVHASIGSAFKGTAARIRDGRELPQDWLGWTEIAGVLAAVLSAMAMSFLAYRTYSRKMREEDDGLLARSSCGGDLSGTAYGSTEEKASC